MAKANEQETLSFATKAAWRSWLAANHAKSDGVWLKFAKKAAGERTLTYAEAVEAALCYGWIDGQSKSLGATHYTQRFTPRRARSLWSKINRAKAEALIAAGEMKPAGLREVERAKSDGRWERAYAAPKAATVPEDLAAALARSRKASAFFASLDSRNRYAILHRLETAAKPETRARRLEKFVAMLKAGEKIYP
jgi:uncharacterized protein YdeI (YjbR/CyaY-like superfamily)